MKNPKRVLIIAAHPDDEILGCGATAARLVSEGYDVSTLILGEGITSRDDTRDRDGRMKEVGDLNAQIRKANKIIGIKNIHTFDLPDNRFDTVPLLDVIKLIERIKNDIRPEIVFTHYWNDLNIDHNVTYKAVLTATRPFHGEPVKEIFCFEILSSTEWEYPLTFSPNIFFDVTTTLELKKMAMLKYTSEIREFPHPRSIKAIELNSKNWGMKIGVKYAESFLCVRSLK